MSGPQRFDCTNGGAQWCQGCYQMTERDDGDYVRSEDYDRLAAENAELRRRVPPDGWVIQSAIAAMTEAAEVLSALTAIESATLPANWRWPLIDELHGLASILSARPNPSAQARSTLENTACPVCEPGGLYATDGTGPWDCYNCGKQAKENTDSTIGDCYGR